jgi:beta-galactosidase
VNWRYVPAISLERVHVRDGIVNARLYNPGGLQKEVDVEVHISDPAGKRLYSVTKKLKPWAGEQEIARFKIDAPQLWSPAKPPLYSCLVTCDWQRVRERFGIRNVEWVDHGPFKLNGERLLLKGTCRHEDHAGLGAAMTEDLIRKEMLMIKDMGANFVRLGHYQQSRIVLDLCDEGPRRARPDAEGRFLRLPIVLGGKTDGAGWCS